MAPSKIKIIFTTLAMLNVPVVLWATRGPDDYGMIMAIMFFIFTFPFGLTLLIFIVYAIAKLKSGDTLKKNQGRAIFIISLIIGALTLLVHLLLMHKSKWNHTMVQLMSGIGIPVLIMSIISAVLAKRLNKRARELGDQA